ncbi:MAG: oligosaccharide flippase family protein [Aliifodinibius sp.]|nr:oligosaccharide flippase family protein [Fodinibius sp.]NIY28957.1 oligosaccharide flippase family protein [Fodinibius sp.]
MSKLAGETEVGLYSAANQLMIPLQLIFDNIVISIFPVMCRKFEASLQSLQQVTENLIELLVAIALPAVICLFVLADSILLLLYGNLDFLHASKVLQIVVWLPILAALKRVLGQVLWASQQEKVSLRIAVINTLISFVVGLLFISWFGLIGAAISAALAALINFFQHYSPATRLFPKISLVRLIWKPILAASCMAIYLILMKDQRVFLAVLTASILYAFVLLAVSVWSVGGLNQLKLKYLYVWSE